MTIRNPPPPQHPLTKTGQLIDDAWLRWIFALVVSINAMQAQIAALEARVDALEGP